MFLELSSKASSAQTIQSWINECTNHMQSAKSSYDSIKNFRIAMDDNEDYTEDDKKEIDAVLSQLNSVAQSFI